jgi:hypothetical protein
MPTRTVTGTLLHPDGTPHTTPAVTFNLTQDIMCVDGIYFRGDIAITTDSNGDFSVELPTPDLPGTAEYNIVLFDGYEKIVNLADGAPITLQDLIQDQFPPVDPVTSLSAHIAAADPHPVYLNETRGDLRYEPLGAVSDHVHDYHTPVFIFAGDSLTLGSGSTPGNDYASVFMQSHAGDISSNLGVAGYTVDDLISITIPAIIALYSGNPMVTVYVWIGSNSLMDADLYSKIAQCHNMLKAAGIKTVAFTLTPRGDAESYGGTTISWDNNRITTNELIRANWITFASALVDLALETRLLNWNDATYFQADKIHLKDAGYALVAGIANGTNPVTTNIFLNPGFENGLTDWISTVLDGGSISDEIVTVHSGSHACKLVAGNANGTYIGQIFTVIPERVYKLRVWSQGDSTHKAYLYALETIGWSVVPGSPVYGSDDITYHEITKSFRIPAGITQIVINMVSQFAQGGIAFIDDTSMTLV